jgi:hypothetical protein
MSIRINDHWRVCSVQECLRTSIPVIMRGATLDYRRLSGYTSSAKYPSVGVKRRRRAGGGIMSGMRFFVRPKAVSESPAVGAARRR